MNIAAKETAITPDVRMSKVFVFIFYYNLLRLTGKTKNINITIAKKRPNLKELFKYLFLRENTGTIPKIVYSGSIIPYFYRTKAQKPTLHNFPTVSMYHKISLSGGRT